MRQRQALDNWDMRPPEMVAYLRYNGYHFNEKACRFAVGRMCRRNSATGRLERVDYADKEKVNEVLKRHNITLENNVLCDYVYAYNMAVADFYKSSLAEEKNLAQFVKDYIDDEDAADGFVFNRWYADTVRAGIPIPWEDLL